jgi:hypothetical protein
MQEDNRSIHEWIQELEYISSVFVSGYENFSRTSEEVYKSGVVLQKKVNPDSKFWSSEEAQKSGVFYRWKWIRTASSIGWWHNWKLDWAGHWPEGDLVQEGGAERGYETVESLAVKAPASALRPKCSELRQVEGATQKLHIWKQWEKWR